MTERDQAALAIMSGLAANPEWSNVARDDPGALAGIAYNLADSLMHESGRVCPVCRAERKPGEAAIVHISGCTYGWPTG